MKHGVIKALYAGKLPKNYEQLQTVRRMQQRIDSLESKLNRSRKTTRAMASQRDSSLRLVERSATAMADCFAGWRAVRRERNIIAIAACVELVAIVAAVVIIARGGR